MNARATYLAIPLVVMLTGAAGATPQFNQSNSMQLMSLGDWSHSYDSLTVDGQFTVRYGTCPRSWWDSPALSLSFVPITWAAQDFSLPEVSYGSFAQARSDCAAEYDLPQLGYIPDSFRFSSLEPLTLDSSDPSMQSEGSSFDESAKTLDVQPERTPISGSRAARELTRAWKKAMQQPPSADVVLILTSHWAHETHGGRSMFNYNFGGIKGHGPDGMSCIREAHEGSGYHVRALRDRFRAYPSAKEGAEDYLSLLIRKYPQAIDALQRGDVADFVNALKRGGYFTGSEADYSRSLSELAIRASEQGFDILGKLASAGLYK